jgi:hypothetical protein
VTMFLNMVNFVQAQQLHELDISGVGSEPLVSYMISISPNLSSLLLGALDLSQITISHNHLSSLSVYLAGQLPQLACPNLTKLNFAINHGIVARRTNNVPLKVELLVLEYDSQYSDNIKEIVSFYGLGSSVKCLMARHVKPPYEVREEIAELFPNLQTWHNSAHELTFSAVRMVVNNCPNLKRVCCADPTIVTKRSKKVLKKNGIIMVPEDSIHIYQFCHHVHAWGEKIVLPIDVACMMEFGLFP